uniref:Chromosomal replication initiator protein DnaA n=1 Tax=candidate division WOR-3 bacterium TaxID=2052148 RepID=A0A7C4CCQ8_UNCW3
MLDNANSQLTEAGEVTPEALWRDVLAYLRTRVGGEGFETWLAPTRCTSISAEQVEVEVPNAFAADWLTQHYLSDIRTAIAATTGRDRTVAFRALPSRGGEVPLTAGSGSGSSPSQSQNHAGRLQLRYTFDSFIVGESNRFACAAARNVANRPGRSFNPLFIYGGVGLGKTHLLHAIGNEALRQRPGIRVLYTAAETLFIELIQAIERNTRLQFKNRYRGLDLLLLDDVHYLVGKERLQEEVFHIFNTLHDSSSQVVFTSDRPAIDIPMIEERLASRLGSGLVVDIQPPDLETRVAILKQKAQQEQVQLPDDTATYIATRVRTSIRALEGALVRLIAMASLDSRPLTVQLAELALKDIVPAEQPLDHRAVISLVAKEFDLQESDIRGNSRTKQVVLARQIAMYLMRTVLQLSLKQTGALIGGKDHTTVIHALEKVEKLRVSDPAIGAVIQNLKYHLAKARST